MGKLEFPRVMLGHVNKFVATPRT